LLKNKQRKSARQGKLANFQFYLDEEPGKTFEGITINVSPQGFNFLTRAAVDEGQVLAISKHTLPDYAGRKAKIIWVKKGPRYIEAGAEFNPQG